MNGKPKKTRKGLQTKRMDAMTLVSRYFTNIHTLKNKAVSGDA